MAAVLVPPSPKLHRRLVMVPAEVSVKLTVDGTVPPVGVAAKPAANPEPAVTWKADDLPKVNVPLGVENTMVASFHPTASKAGMLNWAVTVYWLECVTELPALVPSMTLDGKTPAGGAGGVSVSKVKVTVKLVPCAAVAGLRVVI